VIGTFEQDLPALFVGIALCTIAAGLFAFALLGRRISNIDLPIAGAFAAAYGLRLILRTPTIIEILGDPISLHYLHSAMEYIVPIPAAMLFERLFGDRFRRLNRITVGLFVVYAIVAIPYEIAVREPGALGRWHNALVVLLIILFLYNIARTRATADVGILRVASAIFAIYVQIGRASCRERV